MKDIIQLFICNIVSIISMVIAGVLVYEQKPYWGWFLFSSLIAMAAVRSVVSEQSDNCCKKSDSCCKRD